uniref:Fibrillar collagen NC1 domain-containing protein n=2 Tax=Scleropages formosus TaxID=113540 RepID=A0A8C9RQS0_SCLFO
MNFLHLLSTEALQHIIVHCLNVAVWKVNASQTPSQKALRFKAWNGQVIQAGGATGPRVLEDSCWMTDDRWHRTHFVFHSQDSSLLPIVDMYNLPITGPGSYFHVEVGPVCFL